MKLMEAQQAGSGVDLLLKGVLLLAEMGNVGDKMGRTAGFARYMHLMQLADELAGLEGVRLSDVMEQAKGLDAAKRSLLSDALKEKLVLVDKDLESAIERALTMLVDAYALVDNAIALFKELKDGAEA